LVTSVAVCAHGGWMHLVIIATWPVCSYEPQVATTATMHCFHNALYCQSRASRHFLAAVSRGHHMQWRVLLTVTLYMIIAIASLLQTRLEKAFYTILGESSPVIVYCQKKRSWSSHNWGAAAEACAIGSSWSERSKQSYLYHAEILPTLLFLFTHSIIL